MLDPRTPLPPSGIAGFADVDAAADPAAYIAFLDAFQRGLAPMIGSGIDLLRLQPGAAVLDVGCGHGAVFELLAARTGAAGHITGLDSSRALLDEARRRCAQRSLRATLHEGDAQRLPFDDAAFDATRADRVLIFLHEPGAALREMVRGEDEIEFRESVRKAWDSITGRKTLVACAEVLGVHPKTARKRLASIGLWPVRA